MTTGRSRAVRRGTRTFIVRPQPRDEVEFLDAVDRSVELHRGWVAPPNTSEAFGTYLRRLRRRDQFGFLIRSAETNELVGVVNVGNVVRRAFQSAYLGYYAFAPHNGRGLMTDGVNTVVAFAFHDLGLHRLEANIQPANAASIRLAQRCGFRKEGFSPQYLRVDGRWRDHERWARISNGPNATGPHPSTGGLGG